MPTVETVRGPIDTADMGPTLMHEHVFVLSTEHVQNYGDGDWWDEDPTSPTYNSFQHVRCGTTPPFGGGSEGMWQQPRPYPFLAVIEYNMRPVVPGKGSGIFLHAQTDGPTIGCISRSRFGLITPMMARRKRA